MPGNYTRVKTWSSGEILTAADLNAEFNNEINNAIPSSIDDYSTNAAQMQSIVSPGDVGTESLATSLSGELERLRYVLNRMIGGSQWYSAPPLSLTDIAQSSKKVAFALEFEGANGGASTTTDVVAKTVNLGAIINPMTWSSADFTTSDLDSTNKKFGAYSFTLGAGNAIAFSGEHGNPFKGSFSAWFRNLAAGDYIAYNPLLGIELYLDSVTSFLTSKITERVATSESVKRTKTVVGASSRAGDATFRNVTTKWRCNDENGASTDLLQLEFSGTDEGTQLNTQDIDINPGLGGVWFFGAKKNDPTWDHVYAANGLPSAHSDAWTKTGTFTEAASSGALNMSISGLTGAQHYSKTNNIDLDGMTIDFKFKLNSVTTRGVILEDRVYVMVRDDSKNRSHAIVFNEGVVSLVFVTGGAPSGASSINMYDILINTSVYHTYRLTSVASGADCIVSLFIDGVKVLQTTNQLAETTAGDVILFGGSEGSNYSYDFNIEQFRYESNGSTTVYPPIAANTQGNLDSIGITSFIISDTSITALQSNSFTDVFGQEPRYGVYLPPTILFERNGNAGNISSTTLTDYGQQVYYIAGDGVTELGFRFGSNIQGSGGSPDFLAAIDVDNDFVGATTPIAYGSVRLDSNVSEQRPFIAHRTVILKPGLHEIRPNVAVTSNSVIIDDAEQIFERYIVKDKKLA